jgi:hypothetical protein
MRGVFVCQMQAGKVPRFSNRLCEAKWYRFRVRLEFYDLTIPLI